MILRDIADYLIARGAEGTGAAWPITVGDMSDDSAQSIGLFQYPGFGPDTLGRECETIGISLRVRSGFKDYEVGEAKWRECFDLLKDVDMHTLPGYLTTVAFSIPQVYSPNVTWDSKRRPNFMTNFHFKIYV